MLSSRHQGYAGSVLLAMLCTVSCGCSPFLACSESIEPVQVAEEDSPATADWTPLSPYVIEPTDIILIDAVKIVPKSPYKVDTFDHLRIVVTGTISDQPISGNYQVEPEGTVNFGPAYGRVKLSGLSIDEARYEVDRHLRTILKEPQVELSLAQSAGVQQITDEHLVGPDGTVNLGTYGSAYVAGMTLAEAKWSIEHHLSQYLDDPEVAVDVFAYNSKVCYIINEATGAGDQLVRVRLKEGDTVFSVLSKISELRPGSPRDVWIIRPSPGDVGDGPILPINWNEIEREAYADDLTTTSRFKLRPGDWIHVAPDHSTIGEKTVASVKTGYDGLMGFQLLGSTGGIQVLNERPLPWQLRERLFGFSLLGDQSIQTMNRFPDKQ
jgi:polysaccharide export outer membrane protein